MKCQQCNKTATFHITELTKGKPQELHLCEEHARQYLTQSEEEPAVAPSLAGVLAHQLAVGQTAEELAKLDQRSCPVCGITFYDFRSQGRLGCPYDFIAFQSQLEPLILNVHGELEHVGKTPSRSGKGTEERTQLIRLRREMAEAVRAEEYERAKELRDKIRNIEAGGS